MQNNWYYRAAKNDILLQKETDVNWKDVRKGLGWGVGLGLIPTTIGLLSGPHGEQKPLENPTKIVEPYKDTNVTSRADISPELSQNITPKNDTDKTSPVSNSNMSKIMKAIYMMESSGGIDTKARFEPEFLKNYGNKGLMPELRKLYGDKEAASSYGPYQVMLVKAWEMGFKVSPKQLAEPSMNKKVAEAIVLKYINAGLSPWQIFKKYNGASNYATRAMKIYENSK